MVRRLTCLCCSATTDGLQRRGTTGLRGRPCPAPSSSKLVQRSTAGGLRTCRVLLLDHNSRVSSCEQLSGHAAELSSRRHKVALPAADASWFGSSRSVSTHQAAAYSLCMQLERVNTASSRTRPLYMQQKRVDTASSWHAVALQ